MTLFGKKDHGEQSKCLIKRVSNKRKLALANREAELLLIAEQLVEQSGFANFTMDKLTASSSYSKGTIYNHFNSKEDLITALCIKSLKKELALFEQAIRFDGHLREKCLALIYVYQLHAFNNPTLFMCVLSAKTPAVMEKSSQERLDELEVLSREATNFCDNLFASAQQDGSLVLAPNISIDNLTFAIWALAFGTNALMVSAGDIESIKRLDNHFAQLTNINLLLDGMNWQPLSTDWDYQDTWLRIEKQLLDQ